MINKLKLGPISLSILLVFCAFIGYTQDRFDEVEIKTIPVTETIFMLQGAGGNIAILNGPDGIVMIDDQFAELAPKINAAIDAISASDIRYLINTHWHGDHTGGNAQFGSEGATIIAHNNVRERLSNEQLRPFSRTTPAAPLAAWPVLTFNEEMNIYFNGETIQLLHMHDAHTDGDAFVYFPQQNVLHMGDCFFKDRFPYIDLGSGGSPAGAMKAIEAALLLSDVDTKIIPGHGSLANRSDLKRYQQMFLIVQSRVQDAIANGLTIEEMDIPAITKGFDGWGDGFIQSDAFIKMLIKAEGE